MATKVDTFVTGSLDDLAQIKHHLEAAANLSRILDNRWRALGRQNMAGWAEYNWEDRPFSEVELRQALANLSIAPAVSVSLLDLNTTGAIDFIVKLGLK